MFERKVGSIRLVSRNESLLDGFGQDLALVLGSSSGHKNFHPAVFLLGIHLGMRGLAVGKDEKLVVVNTEHLFDAEGQALPRLKTRNPFLLNGLRSNFSQALKHADLIVDLSEFNRSFWESLRCIPKKGMEKILFGPFFFPDSEPLQHSAGEGLAFFGTMTPRRLRSLEAFVHKNQVSVYEDVFGQELLELSQASEAILNFHAYEGVYAEWPRLLSALLAGREVWSELLPAPLIPDHHYRLIHEDGKLSERKEGEDYLSNLSSLVRNLFPFSRVLDALAEKKSTTDL